MTNLLCLCFRILNRLFYHKYSSFYKAIYFKYKEITNKSKIVILKSIIQPGERVIDVGANIGFFTILLSKLVKPSGKVYAFEPEPNNFYYLKKNTKHQKNIICNQTAVGAINQNVRLYISNELNVDHQTYDNGEKRSFLTVSCVCLDKYFPSPKTIDFIKIDAQGFDFKVILGAKNLIKRSRRIKLMGEFWPYGLAKAGSNPKDYINFLKSSGFKVKFFSDHSLTKILSKSSDETFYVDFFAYKNTKVTTRP